MNRMILFAAALCASAIVASTASASVIYNSPSDGFAFTGYSTISGAPSGSPSTPYTAFDTFSVSSPTTITGVSFDSWTISQPGHTDVVTDVSWEILDLYKKVLVIGTANPIATFYADNLYGFEIDINTFTVPNLDLKPGIYYLGLYNALSVIGRPVGWDQTTNSASGYIPSATQTFPNTFQIFGEPVGVPEPASWALMIAGFGAVGGVLRRRRSLGGLVAA